MKNLLHFITTSTSSIMVILCCLLLLLSTIAINFTSATSTFISGGTASPLRTASYYMFSSQTGTATGTAALGTMYVFRQGKTLNSSVIPNQRPILSINGDIRRVILVEVPAGSVSIELTTFDEVNFASPSLYIQHTNIGYFAVAPVYSSSGFTGAYASNVHETSFPNTTCFLENGNSTFFADFGFLKEGIDFDSSLVSNTVGVKSGVIYQQFSSILAGNPFLGYLLDSVPGDITYTPLRRVVTVNVPDFKRSVSEVNQFTLTETSSFVVIAFTSVAGVDESPSTLVAETGYHSLKSVRFVSMNASRMGNLRTSPTRGMGAAKLFRIPGQSTPILQYAPGDSGYSDLLAIVDVVFASGTQQTTGYMSYNSLPSNATYTYTGRYLNCLVLNSASSWSSASSTDALPPSNFPVFYKGTTKTCFNFSYVETGCALRPSYVLRRIGDGSLVANNDIFPFAAEYSLSATPFVWRFTYPVPQLYVTGEIKSFSSLISAQVTSISQASYSIGSFFNNVMVSRSKLPSVLSTLPVGKILSKSTGLNNWTMNFYAPGDSAWAADNQVCIEVRAQFGHSAIAVGFGRDATTTTTTTSTTTTTTSSQNLLDDATSLQHSLSTVFVVGHFTSFGTTCVRTLLRDSNVAGTFNDIDGVATLNLTNANFVLDEDTNAVKLQFCRNRFPTSSLLTAATVGIAPSLERLEIATGPVRTSFKTTTTISQSDATATLPSSCSAALDSALWASVTRLQVDWNSYLPINLLATTAPGFTSTSATTTTTAAVVATTPAPNSVVGSGSGYYRLNEDHVLSWKTLPAGVTNPTEVEFFLTFPVNFNGWMALGFGAATWLQSDILFCVHHPVLGTYVEDRKGITLNLWREDIQQDWKLGNAADVDPQVPALVTNTTRTLAFKRKLDSLDRGISTQDIARTELKAGILARSTGYGGGVPIELYNLANGPVFTADNFTRSNVYYMMTVENVSDHTPHPWQKDIVDVVPGQDGYSDLWRISYVSVPASFKGPEIASLTELSKMTTWVMSDPVSASVDPSSSPSGSWMNCPIVHPFSAVDSSTVSLRNAWYRGTQVRCVQFDSRFNAHRTSAQKGLRILSADTNETLDWLLEYAPTTDNSTYTNTNPPLQPLFSPFVRIYNVYIPAGAVYNRGMYRSFNDFLAFS
jgi:hypothetical protein